MQATLAKSPQNFRRRISSSARSLYPCDIKGKSASATPISTYEQNGAIDQFDGILPPSLNEYNEGKIFLYMQSMSVFIGSWDSATWVMIY